MLGEEMTLSEQQRLLTETTTGLWLVDPLDGTMNYRNGVPFFAVSVALLVRHEIVLGVVYDPSRDECFTALHGLGAWLNEQPLNLRQQVQPEKMLVGLVDFKRLPPALAQRLATQPPYQSQRSFGSVALDWCWLAAGRAQVYVHGKQNLWDYTAGALVFAEAGGYACTLQGEPVFNGELAPRSAVLAVNQQHFRQWCKYLEVPDISLP
jgi:myo-inositol-1(or 4)-monophosphatase